MNRPQIMILAVIAIMATTAGLALRVFTAHGPSPGSDGKALSSRTGKAGGLSSRTIAESSEMVGPLQEILDRERKLAKINPSEFPFLMEAELSSLKDSNRAFTLARRWAKTDPEGYLAWLRKHPEGFLMREHGYYIGLKEMFVQEMVKHDPRRAWKLAEEFQRQGGQGLQARTLVTITNQDSGLALELARESRLELSRTNSGWWQADPIKTLPVLKELLPSPGREALIRECVQSFSNRPSYMKSKDRDKVAESKEWFGQLQPEMQSSVLSYAEAMARYNGLSDEILNGWKKEAEAE